MNRVWNGYMPYTCPICHRFVRNTRAWINGLEQIFVRATCSLHGCIEPEGWQADDFVFEEATS